MLACLSISIQKQSGFWLMSIFVNMAFSLKHRVQPKSHISSGGHDDANALGKVLHRSTKTKKKKHNHLSDNNTIEVNIQTSPIDDPIIYRSKCPCDTHYNKQLLERNYDLTIDKLFDLIFGSNEFVRTYRQAQRFYDEEATEWIMNETTNYRERTITYKVPYESTFIGKGTICTREKQRLLHETPGSHYVLEAEVFNEGVKFCDTFSLTLRYCLVQKSITTTNLCVTAQISYIKSVNGFVKQIIERNAYSASQEGLKDLNNRLNLITNYKMEKRRSSKDEIALTAPNIEHDRRLSQHDAVTTISPSQSLPDHNKSSQSSDSGDFMYILAFLIAILLLMHIHLHMRLHQMDFLADNLAYLLKK